MPRKSRTRLGEGRILRLKQGYNPNSSSIGTIVFMMPAALLGVTAAFGTAAGLICAAFLRGERRNHGNRQADGQKAP
jgi:hypothetical protein